MNFNFIQDTSSIKNNFQKVGSFNQAQVASSKSASIFMDAAAMNPNSFGNAYDIKPKSFDTFSMQQQNVKPQDIESNNSGFFGKIANFFGGNQVQEEKPSPLANAQSILQNAKSLTGSLQAQELLAQAEGGEKSSVNNKSIDFSEKTENKEDKEDKKENKDKETKDYSKSTRLELLNAMMQGKPSNAQEATQMLQNQSLPADYIEKIKQKFPNDKQVQDLIGEMQAGV